VEGRGWGFEDPPVQARPALPAAAGHDCREGLENALGDIPSGTLAAHHHARCLHEPDPNPCALVPAKISRATPATLMGANSPLEKNSPEKI